MRKQLAYLLFIVGFILIALLLLFLANLTSPGHPQPLQPQVTRRLIDIPDDQVVIPGRRGVPSRIVPVVDEATISPPLGPNINNQMTTITINGEYPDVQTISLGQGQVNFSGYTNSAPDRQGWNFVNTPTGPQYHPSQEIGLPQGAIRLYLPKNHSHSMIPLYSYIDDSTDRSYLSLEPIDDLCLDSVIYVLV